VYVGTESRRYSSTGFGDETVVDFGGELSWYLSPITSLQVSLARGVEEASSATSSGYTETALDIDVEHELRRNLLVALRMGTANIEDNGSVANNASDTYYIGADAKYYIGRNWDMNVGLNYTDRDADIATDSYNQTLLQLSLRYVY